jgi:hypothetical protein
MNDVTLSRDANPEEPVFATQGDRDDCGDLWAAWDDIGGEG